MARDLASIAEWWGDPYFLRGLDVASYSGARTIAEKALADVPTLLAAVSALRASAENLDALSAQLGLWQEIGGKYRITLEGYLSALDAQIANVSAAIARVQG